MNFWTAVILIAIGACAFLSVRKLIKDHKSGKGCGGDCRQCGHCAHKAK